MLLRCSRSHRFGPTAVGQLLLAVGILIGRYASPAAAWWRGLADGLTWMLLVASIGFNAWGLFGLRRGTE
jgi:hypothetical protein